MNHLDPLLWKFLDLFKVIKQLVGLERCLRYTYDQRYDRALEIYLRLRHKDVYQLIHKHNLFSSIEDKIVLLMDFDKEVKTKLLLNMSICITVSTVFFIPFK